MSPNLNNVRSDYVDRFPNEVPIKMAQSFLVTATICLVSGGVANVALLGGAIAATATVIEALTRPIIKSVFSRTPIIARCIQVVIPQLMALRFSVLLTPLIGVSYKATSFALPFIAWIILNEGYYETNTGMAVII